MIQSHNIEDDDGPGLVKCLGCSILIPDNLDGEPFCAACYSELSPRQCVECSGDAEEGSFYCKRCWDRNESEGFFEP
jgi:hypothetical protein